jgi:hypothetical protein
MPGRRVGKSGSQSALFDDEMKSRRANISEINFTAAFAGPSTGCRFNDEASKLPGQELEIRRWPFCREVHAEFLVKVARSCHRDRAPLQIPRSAHRQCD